MYRQESYTTYYVNTLCLNFWANPCSYIFDSSQSSHIIHQTESERMSFPQSICYIITPAFVWVKADLVYSTQQTFLGHSLAAYCSVKSCLQSCSELKPGRSYFYSLYQTKVKEEQPSPDSYNEQRPRRATTQAAKQRGIFQKCCVENNSEI